MGNIYLEESQTGIKIAGRNINNLRYSDETSLMAESKEELKNLFMRVKEESEKAGLKLNTQKTKIKVFSHITSYQIEGEIVEMETDFISWASKSLQIVTSAMKLKNNNNNNNNKHLLVGKKAMTNLDSILKSRDITLSANVHIVKAIFFSSSHVLCESWTIKKAEC